MGSNTYSEEEFKKLLKNLFSEKKRVRDLEKQLEEKGLQGSFQSKLAAIHQFSITEEYGKLKAENDELKQQISQVRPTLKKLMTDLKSAQGEIQLLKSQERADDSEALKNALQEAEAAIATLQETNHTLAQRVSEHAALEAEMHSSNEKVMAYVAQINTLNHSLHEAQATQAHSAAQIEHLELERGRLVERLAATVAEHQKQSELLVLQREELGAQQNEIEHLRAKLERVEQELQESDFVILRQEYEAKMHEALICFSQKEAAHEESLERCYVKMREMSHRHAEMVEERERLYKSGEEHKKFLSKLEKEHIALQASLKSIKVQYEEMEGELIQSGQLLAKKVKETTLLGDEVESQKNQIGQLYAEQEKVSQEWHNKVLVLQQEVEEKNSQLNQLQTERATYEQMAATLSNLKNLLGNTLEPSQSENAQNPGN